MISESSYWKDSLLRYARHLRERKSQRRWPDASLAQVEQTVMLAFYSIRKLVEAAKVATTTAEMKISLSRYSWKGKAVTRMNGHNLNQFYDFDSPRTVRLPLRQVCNQIVHSYVFCIGLAEAGGLDGFFFVSNRDRHRHLFWLSVDGAARLFEHVGKDYPNEIRMVLNPRTRDCDVHAITHPEGAPANKRKGRQHGTKVGTEARPGVGSAP